MLENFPLFEGVDFTLCQIKSKKTIIFKKISFTLYIWIEDLGSNFIGMQSSSSLLLHSQQLELQTLIWSYNVIA